MNRTSASGEQAALRGYKWQYDQIAKLVYDAIRDGKLISVRLTDPNAGQVDDLVLVCTDRTDAYQFKSGAGTVTFRAITRDQTTRSGSPAPPLVRALADAWKNLQDTHGQTHVHLFTKADASVHDQVVDRHSPVRPSPNHFKAFLTTVLEPLHSGTQTGNEIDECWLTALKYLRERSGVNSKEFVPFLQSLHFNLNARSGLDMAAPTRRDDLIALSTRLERLASAGNGVVKLDTAELLDLMHWKERTRLHSAHTFPINLATYTPLSDAIEQLNNLVVNRRRGYIAVVGPPGAGKSTLLTQALSGTSDRVIRYYAYVPETDAARTRLTGHSFLHDVILELKHAGLQGQDLELTSTDTIRLRRQRSELFDSASQEFSNSGRRTIIIVDGLDHVEREYSGHDGLLSELPKVDELPMGVLLVVGTRTLSPLRPDVRQNIKDCNATVDLSRHRLSHPAIRNICSRTPGVSELGKEVHQYIVERCDGHPLSLSYLLNRLRGEQTESAIDILKLTPDYTGDIGASYQAIWDGVKSDDALVHIFTICSRLRIGFRTKWLAHILSDTPLKHRIIQRFIRNFQYLFRVNNNEWRFFHDSFRQFAVEHTALGPDCIHDHEADTAVHQEIAEICSQSNDWRLNSEQLHHRYLGKQHDNVLALASQTAWRRQFQNFRSPSLIRDDIDRALEVAAGRANVIEMLRALLGRAELQSRIFVLERVDLPRALYDAGLASEAIEWCLGKDPEVLLAHRYNLAWMLGREGNTAGRHLFDANEHYGFDEPSNIIVGGYEDDVALAWTRSAAMFREIASVIQSIENHLVEQTTTKQKVYHGYEYEAWNRYLLMMRELIDATLDCRDTLGLNEIDKALAGRLTALETSDDLTTNVPGEQREQQIAAIIDLRFRVVSSLQAVVQDPEVIVRRITSLLTDTNSKPKFPSTLLGATELLANLDLPEEAKRLFDAFTLKELADDRHNEATDAEFKYLRLCYRLATGDEEVPASILSTLDTPARDAIPHVSSMYHDILAIRFDEHVGSLIQELARIDAKTQRENRETKNHVWSTVLRVIDIVPADKSKASITRQGNSLRAPQLLKTAVEVVINYGYDLPQRLSDELSCRFREYSTGWLATPLLDVMHVLESAGADVTWIEEVIDVHLVSVAKEDVDYKIRTMADLIHHCSVSGSLRKAAELARDLSRAVFAVGARKDRQFDEWVSLYVAAIAEPDGAEFLEDGSWLTRLLSAVEPMTEGAPSNAAVGLPAGLVAVDPLAAIRTFEYLVRRGIVPHFSALANLVRGLVEQIGSEDANMLALVGDITSHLIAAGAARAYPELAKAVTVAANRVDSSLSAIEFAKSLAAHTDRFALATTRAEWHRGLGLANDSAANEKSDDYYSQDDDYYALVLNDGRRIAFSNAVTQMKTVDDILGMRQAETSESRFPWYEVIRQQHLTSDDMCQLIPLFQGGDHRELNVLVTLAEIAERNGNRELALELATDAFHSAQGDTWATNMGGIRLRSATIRLRLDGDQPLRIEVCKDLARQVGRTPWMSNSLSFDLQEIAAVLDPNVTNSLIWPLAREYLEGIAEPLDLGEDDPFKDYGCRWWSPVPSTDHRDPCRESTPHVALAELVIGHLLHPSRIVSDATTTIIVHALARGDEYVAQTLARFARPDASDNLLERSGRCLAAARERYKIEIPSCLKPLDLALTTHLNQALRDLAEAQPSRVNRALDGAYQLALPMEFADSNTSVFLPGDLYEDTYQLLAQYSSLDLAAILRVSSRYMDNALATLPTNEDIRSVLEASAVKHNYPLSEAIARRAAFGRVVADFRDAGMLDGVPPKVNFRFRTVDIDLVGRTPGLRPEVIPDPPTIGYEQTCKQWLDELDARLQAYIRSSDRPNRRLIGAKTQLAVLNWDHLEEEFQCGTTIGDREPLEDGLFLSQTSMRLSDLTVMMKCEDVFRGGPLVLENHAAYAFHQIQADWLAFRPDLARVMGWSPDPSCFGRWLTPANTLAVETVWWIDGWWGRAERMFNDTVATGHTVLITEEGIASIQDTFGTPVRHFLLTRRGKEERANTESVTSKESAPLRIEK